MASNDNSNSNISEEEINRISNLNAAFKMLKLYNVNRGGLRSLDDARTRLRLHINGQIDLQNINTIQNVLENDNKARLALAALFDGAKKRLQGIDELTCKVIATSLDNPNWKEELEKNSQKLQNKENTILVAGETSSGKSSLINLLIGEELLPTAVTSSTSCITIIRYGEIKKFKVYRETPDPETGKTENVYLFQDKDYMKQLSTYVRDLDRNTVWPYKMVEVFWPVPILQSGTVIVDSPGIGENENMTARVHNYLANAFAFIYVVNSNNAGGIQKERLQKLLEEIYDLHKKRLRTFDPQSAIFVCNKWDLINSDQQDLVKNDTYEKLTKIWRGCRKDQIYFMSISKALLHYSNGRYVTDDYRTLLRALQALIPISSKRMIEVYWSKLYNIFNKVVRCYRFKVNSAIQSEEERLKLNTQLVKIIKTITQEMHNGEIKKQLCAIIDIEVNRISRRLYQYLKSDDSHEFLCHWNDSDLPPVGDDFNSTLAILQDKIKDRLAECVSNWETKYEEFAKLETKLQDDFDHRLGNIRRLMRSLQMQMIRSQSNASDATDTDLENEEMTTELLEEFSFGEKLVIAATSPVWIPIALIVGIVGGILVLFVGSVLGFKSLATTIAQNKQKSKYKKNPVEYIKTLMEMMLSNLTEKQINELIEKEQAAQLREKIENLFEKLPRTLDALTELFDQEFIKTQRDKQMVEQTKKKLEKLVQVYNLLAAFRIYYFKKYDYGPDSILDYNPVGHSGKIGEGAYGIVFKRHLKLSDTGSTVPIALKMFKNKALMNLHDVIREAMILRDLQHKNIVKLFGIVHYPKDGEEEIGLAFELCQCTLYQYLQRNPDLVPGSTFNKEICKQAYNKGTLPFACQLVKAVFYIHQQGYIHRDLKMDNVLIGNDRGIRLCDVGGTKRQEDVTNTICGTLLYMAPEVENAEGYNAKADIYSMSIVFWELWYGENLTANEMIALRHLSRIRKGEQLPLDKPSAVYAPYAQLIKKCGLRDPNERPSSEECIMELHNIRWD